MENPHTTHLAAGGTLLAFGGAGLIALAIYQATPNAKAWDAIWFLVLVSILGLVALFGGYLFAAATYIESLPLPTTRYERENAPNLEVLDARINEISGNTVRFELAFINRGRLDIRGAVVSVAVPANIVTGLARCTREGGVVSPATERIPQSVYENDHPDYGPSLTWTDRDDFPGRTTRPMYFRCDVLPLRDFRVGYSVVAAELKGPLKGLAEVAPSGYVL